MVAKRYSNFPSTNESIEKDLIPLLIKHIQDYVCRYVELNAPCFVRLDGNSSLNGYKWLEDCQKINCQVIQSTAHTSHLLQPCDTCSIVDRL